MFEGTFFKAAKGFGQNLYTQFLTNTWHVHAAKTVPENMIFRK